MKWGRQFCWTDRQRKALLVIIGAMLAYGVIRYAFNPQFVPDPQPETPARADELCDRIDPNTAGWESLAALPTIGEKRARDIVAYREKFLADHPGGLAYFRAGDLLRIRGIGGVILSQIEPYLQFPSAAPTTTRSD